MNESGDYHLTIFFEELSIQTLFAIWKEYMENGDKESYNIISLVDKVVSKRPKAEFNWYVSSQILWL